MARAYASNLKPKAGDKVLYNWPKGSETPATIKTVTGNRAEIRFDGQNGVVNCATVFISSIKFVERPKKAVLAEKVLSGVKAVKP